MPMTAATTEVPRIWLVVPAAGAGSRMGAGIPKQYLPLAGKTVFQQTLERLCAQFPHSRCVVALAEDDATARSLPLKCALQIDWVIGGNERMDSVIAGLNALIPSACAQDWVLVHDVARPCIHPDSLSRLCERVAGHSVGGILAIPVRDTLKRENAAQHIAVTVDRKHLWQAQTPQMFRYGLLKSALETAREKRLVVTDEASAMELAGHAVQLVEGRGDNLKITFPDDLELAEWILAGQQHH